MSGIEEIRSKFVVDSPTDNETKEKNKVEELEINKLVCFKSKHPFKTYNEKQKYEMKESIKENGVLVPIIVRKIDNEMYEIISGHNRVECSKELGLKTIPAIIIECDDDKATLIMLDTNLCNRDYISPIEKGYAYKIKLETLKKLNNITNIKNFSPMENQDSVAQIYRYIRLTELIKTLQEKVNNEIIPIRAGIELSYLSIENQEIVNKVLNDLNSKINVIQAKRIRNLNDVNYETILNEIKVEKNNKEKFTGKLKNSVVKKYKDRFSSNEEFTNLVIKLLNEYFND